MQALNTKKIKAAYYLLLVLAVLAGSGCSKYPDGPSFSLLPKKWRLDENWKRAKVYKNGTEVSSQALSNVKSESFNIHHDGSYSYSTSFNSGGSYDYTGTWAFSSDKTVLYFTYVFGNTYQTDVYLILRLKEHDMWLRTVDLSGDVYENHYVPN